MKPLVILAGPTAVGKTALSIKLAKKINGAIISADSMQVYKHMDIGSAKVMPEEMEGIPHYLINVLEPSEEFNIVPFSADGKRGPLQANLCRPGRIPIIAGGTRILHPVPVVRHRLFQRGIRYGIPYRTYGICKRIRGACPA